MLRPPFEGGDRSEARVQKLGQLYQEFENTKLRKDIGAFKEETENLTSYSQEIHDLLRLITVNKGSASLSLRSLEKEIGQLNVLKHRYESQLNELQKAHHLEKSRVDDLRSQYAFKKKQRVAISDTLNLNTLVKLDMEDRNSKAHEVFIWVLAVMYREPSNKYYWDNFKEQALQGDQGVDFKHRMGKISAADLREEEKVATEKLIQTRPHLGQFAQFADPVVMIEISKIFDIARLLLDGFQICQKSKIIQQNHQLSRDQRLEKEAAISSVKCKFNAIQDQKNLNIKYSRTLENVQKQLAGKDKVYSDLRQEGVEVLGELQSLQRSNVNANQDQGWTSGGKHNSV